MTPSDLTPREREARERAFVGWGISSREGLLWDQAWLAARDFYLPESDLLARERAMVLLEELKNPDGSKRFWPYGQHPACAQLRAYEAKLQELVDRSSTPGPADLDVRAEDERVGDRGA